MDKDTAGLIVVVVIGIVTYRYCLKRRHGQNYPPGPLGLPGVGSMFFMSPNPAITYLKFAKKYGTVFSIQIGWKEWIIINDFHSAREALVKQGEKFSGRPDLYVTTKLSEGLGVIFVDGALWKSQRRFGLVTLTGFGLGKSSLEERIKEEAGFLIEVLGDSGGKPINCQKHLTNAVSNIICSIVMGSRFSYDDERLCNIIERLSRRFLYSVTNNRIPSIASLLYSFSGTTDAILLALMTLIPSFRFFPVFGGAYKRQFTDLDAIFETLRGIVDEHRNSFDKDNIRDFIDTFINESKKNEANSFFKERQLLHYVRDLFVAGTDTTSNSLRWSILSLLHWPECQEKVQKEIDRVIGNESPSMDHREHMPYTCAWIQEVMRHRTLLPLMAPRRTCTDVTLGRFKIPKDTAVMVNIWAIHYDANYFKNPSQFRPDRFIDSEGKYVPCDHVMPFSIGPRQCLGAQLVKAEMFIFLTSILQKFSVRKDPKSLLPSFDSGVFGLTYVPHQFTATFESRLNE